MPLVDAPCPTCKSKRVRTERISLPNGGHHIKALCGRCGRFLKFISHDSPKFYFGRYKGETVVEVMAKDPSYLKWCLAKKILRTAHLRDAVKGVLKR